MIVNLVRFSQVSMGVGLVGVFFVVNNRVYKPYLKEVQEKGSYS